MGRRWLVRMTAACVGLAGAMAQAGMPSDAEAEGPNGVSPTLVAVLELHSVANGIAVATDGRIFMPLSHLDGSTGPQVVEWKNGAPAPYPDAGWNGSEAEPGRRFVRANALRIGPHGALWVVDVGVIGFDGPVLPHGPKLVRIDLATNKVSRVYPLDSALEPGSAIDDVRFHGNLAYVTDAGSPGIIVLDLTTGAARRVFDKDPSVTAQRPISAEEHVLRGLEGKPVKIHADQLEVSPDGRFFYYQPASGPMSRVATRYLDDPKLPAAQLSKHVTTFVKTRSTGSTAIAADGTIYVSDVDHQRILAIDPAGSERTVIEDPRLVWVDGMWIDRDGWLYMPAAQLDRLPPFNGGVSKVQWPVTVYKMRIDARPPANDHP